MSVTPLSCLPVPTHSQQEYAPTLHTFSPWSSSKHEVIIPITSPHNSSMPTFLFLSSILLVYTTKHAGNINKRFCVLLMESPSRRLNYLYARLCYCCSIHRRHGCHYCCLGKMGRMSVTRAFRCFSHVELEFRMLVCLGVGVPFA